MTMVVYLYNLYIFVWIQTGCLDDKVFTLEPSSRVKKRLWCLEKIDLSLYQEISDVQRRKKVPSAICEQ